MKSIESAFFPGSRSPKRLSSILTGRVDRCVSRGAGDRRGDNGTNDRFFEIDDSGIYDLHRSSGVRAHGADLNALMIGARISRISTTRISTPRLFLIAIADASVTLDLCLIEGIIASSLTTVVEGYVMLGVVESIWGEERFKGLMELIKKGMQWVLKHLALTADTSQCAAHLNDQEDHKCLDDRRQDHC
mgnify:CR=1 FL=1